MATLTLSQVITALTVDNVKTGLYSIATSVGLNVTTWGEGDPTRTIFAVMAQAAANREGVIVAAIKGGLLDYASEAWLTLLASNVYNVSRIEETFASGQITLTSSGADTYVLAAGDLVVESTTTGKTYRNTSGGTLNGGGTLTLDILAEEAGSASTSGATEIDGVVTPTLLNVTVANAASVVGADAESDEALRERCRDSLGALSPNGPAAAYEYVAKSTLRADGTVVDINRVRVSPSSSTGLVTVTLAAPTGAPIAGDVTLVESAINSSVVPLTATPTIAAATENTIAVTYELFVISDEPQTDGEIEAAVQANLEAYFAAVPIGGVEKTAGVYRIYLDTIESLIAKTIPDAKLIDVDVSLPAGDVTMLATEVPILGTVTPTITRVVQT